MAKGIQALGVCGNKFSVSVDHDKKEIIVGVKYPEYYKGEYGKIGEISSWDADDFQYGEKAYEPNIAKYIQRGFGMLKKVDAPIRIK